MPNVRVLRASRVPTHDTARARVFVCVCVWVWVWVWVWVGVCVLVACVRACGLEVAKLF